MKILLILMAMGVAGAGAFHTHQTRDQFISAALYSEAFALTSSVKLRVADYYLQNRAMPHRNADVGLEPPNSLFGTSVKRVAINRGGVLQVDFEEELGKSTMVFTPTTSGNRGLLSWRCTSDSIKPAVLEKLRPTCNYLPDTPESQLMKAIANSSVGRIQKALNDGADVNALVQGNTPLMLAARIGDTDVIEELINQQAEIDHLGVNSERRTPLMVAISSNNPEAVALLLAKGASVNRTDHFDKSALHYAREVDERIGGERFTLMVAARLNPNFAGENGMGLPTASAEGSLTESSRLRTLHTNLIEAATNCRAAKLQSLLDEANALSKRPKVRSTSLKALAENADCSDALLAHVQGTSVFAEASYESLMHEVRQCRLESVKQLVSGGGIVDVSDTRFGVSVFEQAALSGCTDLVAYWLRQQDPLVKLQPDLIANVIEQSPQTSLIPLISQLIEAGADVNGLSKEGNPALSVAIAAGQPVVAKYLINAGAEVNATSARGSFPLVDATQKGHSHLVTQLLSAGADVNATDQLGRTAVLVAVAHAKDRLVDRLLRAGANPYQKDVNGISALILAQRSGSKRLQSLITATATTES